MPKPSLKGKIETAAKPPKKLCETIAETVKRNRETIPIGEGAMVSPLVRAAACSAPAGRGSAPLRLCSATPTAPQMSFSRSKSHTDVVIRLNRS
jgi:hypothetical protein